MTTRGLGRPGRARAGSQGPSEVRSVNPVRDSTGTPRRPPVRRGRVVDSRSIPKHEGDRAVCLSIEVYGATLCRREVAAGSSPAETRGAAKRSRGVGDGNGIRAPGCPCTPPPVPPEGLGGVADREFPAFVTPWEQGKRPDWLSDADAIRLVDFRKTVIHSKESPKFNKDCTICRPCQSMTSESIVRE